MFRSKTLALFLFIIIAFQALGHAAGAPPKRKKRPVAPVRPAVRVVNNSPGTVVDQIVRNLHQAADLCSYGLEEKVLKYAFIGYLNLRSQGQITDRGVLTIVDFSKPSTEKRFWVVDVVNQKMLLHTYVAHGEGSGHKLPTKFSNTPDSFQSSLGFYVTGETYHGGFGTALALDGAERNFNSNARARSIVLHGSDHVGQRQAVQGKMGRSQGCPAVPMDEKDKIIKYVKNRTCLFVYYPDKNYLRRSAYLNVAYSGLLL
jgi:L,D-transpeptidase catalytic domain